MPQRKIQGEGKKLIDHKRLAESILQVAETTGFKDKQELFENLRNFEDFDTSRKGNFKNLGFWDFLKAFKKIEKSLEKTEEPSLVEKSEASRKDPKSRLTGVGQGARRLSGADTQQRDLTKVKKPQLKQKKKASGAAKRRQWKMEKKMKENASGVSAIIGGGGAGKLGGATPAVPRQAAPAAAPVSTPSADKSGMDLS